MSIKDYFLYSELSLAAYADLIAGTPDLDDLQDRGMTLTQAQAFASNWTVIDQYDGTIEETYTDEFGQEHTFLNHTGLSVTLFEDSSGKRMVAIRGTEPTDPADIITDVVDIGILGTSEHQAQYAALSAQVWKWIDDGDLQSGFTVTGHSLGGFLATNLTLEYSADVTETFIYNAPGVTGVGGNILEGIANALSPGNPISIPAVLSISNIVATDDVVSSVGLSIAPPIVISVDAQSPLSAHSIVGLTSTLAIYNLFSTISGSDDVNDFTPFLENMSDKHTLSVVNDIFQAGVDTSQVSVDLAMELTEYVNNNGLTNLSVTSLHEQSASSLQSAAKNDKAVLFALNELACLTISGNQPGYANINADDFTEKYFEDRAMFLYYLAHPDATVSNFDPDIDFVDNRLGISLVVDNGMISLQDDSQYLFGNLEREYLAGGDEIDHLYGMGGNDTLRGYGGNDYIEGGQGLDTMYGGSGNDTFYIQGNNDEAYDNFDGGGDTDTILGSSGDDTIRVNSLSPSNSIEIINGAEGENIIAGTESNNTINLTGITVSNINRIEGGTGHDTIIGSSGADILYGGSKDQVEDYSRDRLEGGAGDDTYYIGVNDSVSDSDGQGTIIFNGQQLPSLTLSQQSENGSYYEDENNSWRAVLGDDDSLMVISGNSSDSFTIRNFSSEQYGITLEAYEAPDVDYDYNLVGTANHDEMGIITWGQNQQYWDLVFTEFPEGTTSNTPFYTQSLPAVAPNMTISGGASGDFLFGFQASDRIDGGTGSDVIAGDLGYWNDIKLTMTGAIEGDVIDGGSGNDWIKGSGGDDQISGGADNDIIESLAGKDVLFGDTGNDVLAGGPGRAEIDGGAGDDALFGDGYFTGSSSVSTSNVNQFGINFTYHEDGYITDYATVGYGIQNDTSAPGNDFLSGGLGRDYLSGGAGYDILYGGEHADTLIGGDGNDQLDGGSGNDWLVGDNGDLSGSGDDILSGGSGNDLLYGLGGHDILYGDSGADELLGFSGNDVLFGGSSDDTMWGMEGDDILNGDTGADTLIGEEGSDTLHGGAGNDYLEGGADRDIYHFNLGDGHDIINDTGDNQITFGSGIAGSDLYV